MPSLRWMRNSASHCTRKGLEGILYLPVGPGLDLELHASIDWRLCYKRAWHRLEQMMRIVLSSISSSEGFSEIDGKCSCRQQQFRISFDEGNMHLVWYLLVANVFLSIRGATDRQRAANMLLKEWFTASGVNWEKVLPFVTKAFNSTVKSATGLSTFQLIFDRSYWASLESYLALRGTLNMEKKQ